MSKSISIVVPIYNQAEIIESFVKQVDSVCKRKNIQYEVIFIDERSSDNSKFVIKSLPFDYPVSYHLRWGEQENPESFIEGLSYAWYDNICVFNNNLQHAQKFLSVMLEHMQGGETNIISYLGEKGNPVLHSLENPSIFIKKRNGFSCDVPPDVMLYQKEIFERVSFGEDIWWSSTMRSPTKRYDYLYSEKNVDASYIGSKGGETTYAATVPDFSSSLLSQTQGKSESSNIETFEGTRDQIKGKGFNHKGKEYIHHSDLEQNEMAFFTLYTSQKFILGFIIVALLAGLVINLHGTLLFLLAVITTIDIDLLIDIEFSQPDQRFR